MSTSTHVNCAKCKAAAALKEKTPRADATPPTRDAPDTSQKAERLNAIMYLVLALGCFGGAFLCARTIEFGRGDLAAVQFIFQIPAMLGTLGLAVFGFMFLIGKAD